jgi:hypothetical protein
MLQADAQHHPIFSQNLQCSAYIQSAKFLINSYTLNTHNLLQGMLQGLQALNIHTPMHLQHDGAAWHLKVPSKHIKKRLQGCVAYLQLDTTDVFPPDQACGVSSLCDGVQQL